MTIALGILASDGVAIAADTQETDGYFKGFALKIHSAMTQTSIHSIVKSAVAVTGAGSAVYMDVLAGEILRRFRDNQDSDIAPFESHLRECIEEFHTKHVTPLPAHLAREVNLIVGAQIEGRHALWMTDVSTVHASPGFAAVGTGGSYARMAIERFAHNMNAESAALLSILGVHCAKEYDQYCGKATTVTFLKNNLAYDVPWYQIKEAEKLFGKYAGMEYSEFLYALGIRSGDDAQRPRKLSRTLRALRKDFVHLASQLLEHPP